MCICLLGLLFDAEGGGKTFYLCVGKLLPVYAVSHLRILVLFIILRDVLCMLHLSSRRNGRTQFNGLCELDDENIWIQERDGVK
jgi:Mg2+/citrate symporter